MSAAGPPRCEIPPWFPRLLDEARGAAAAALERATASAVRHRQLDAESEAADRRFTKVAGETGPARRALYDAEVGAKEARLDFHAAERRLQAAPRRHRRSVRREVQAAADRMRDAQIHLEQVQQRTAPDLERFGRAVTEKHHADENQRSLRIAEMLYESMPTTAECDRRVAALEVWHRWANGADVPAQSLNGAYDTLVDRRHGVDHRLSALAERMSRASAIATTSRVASRVQAVGVRDQGPSLEL